MALLEPGAKNLASGRQQLSTTAAEIVPFRGTRRRVTLKNVDSSITVYVGPATVSATNGMPLLAGESISLETLAAVQGISASGTPYVHYIEEYD